MAEVVFAPLKRNVEKLVSASDKTDSNDRGRILLGTLCFFIILFCVFALLYAMTACLKA
jgi:hypothetical protein